MAWEILGTIRPWDLTNRQETPRLTAYRQGVEWAGFSADGHRLYACGSNGDLGVWDAATGRRQGAPRKIDAPWRAHPQPVCRSGTRRHCQWSDRPELGAVRRTRLSMGPGEGR